MVPIGTVSRGDGGGADFDIEKLPRAEEIVAAVGRAIGRSGPDADLAVHEGRPDGWLFDQSPERRSLPLHPGSPARRFELGALITDVLEVPGARRALTRR